MHLLPRPGVKGQSLVTDIKHVRLIEHLRVNVYDPALPGRDVRRDDFDALK